MTKARSRTVGRLPGYRQVTLYVKPELYEHVRYASVTLGEDIYEFVDEALTDSIKRRITTKAQRDAVAYMANQNLTNRSRRAKR